VCDPKSTPGVHDGFAKTRGEIVVLPPPLRSALDCFENFIDDIFCMGLGEAQEHFFYQTPYARCSHLNSLSRAALRAS
jgi:hypothetical protein